ncbi:hypothetical protein GF361_01000 [Candidatus Woesearchaeota archaeon]|nr:hypothetical protein [Candidatus Woesearchaeota archaeon]
MMLPPIVIFILSIIALIISGSLLVRSLTKIANFLHVSEYTIGFILLAFATSVPELFVGIASAIEKNTAIILGTVIGSNIANLTIIIGIPILLAKGMKIQSKKTGKDSLYMVILCSLPLALMLIGNEISRIDGVILILSFFIYVRKIFSERKRFSKELENKVSRWSIITSVGVFLFSLVALFFSANFLVSSATDIALSFAVPPILIGLFMVAIGTSLPELVSGTTAALKGHPEMSIGNVIGSNIANVTFILGITALIFPITSNFLLFITSGVYMLITAFIFATFIRSGKRVDWEEGLSLVLLYVFFIILEVYIKGAIAVP